jgi:hypothetical protein
MGPAKLEVPIPQARPRRGGDRDVGTKRYGKVVSVHEIELLENMRKEHQESSAEDGGSELRVESPESGVQQGRPSVSDLISRRLPLLTIHQQRLRKWYLSWSFL